MSNKKGELIIAGTGIKTVGQLTLDAIAAIENSEVVYYVVGDPIGIEAITSLNANAVSLFDLYEEGKPRIDTYNKMAETLLESVRNGNKTCGVFYGHPGIFVYPSHEAIRKAREEGYKAIMLPGISAEDCLFADIGIDPARYGCQSYEATDFLANGKSIDPASSVVLWQIGVLGNWTFSSSGYDLKGIPLLLQKLYRYYSSTHIVYVYEAPTYPNCDPVIKATPLYRLAEAGLSAISTLFIPPATQGIPDASIYSALGLPIG